MYGPSALSQQPTAMGQTTSWDAGTRVYSRGVEVSDRLGDALDRTVDSDFLRKQQHSKEIEDEVAERLRQARLKAEASVEDAKQRVSLVDEARLEIANSHLIAKGLEELHTELANRPRRGLLSADTEAVRQKLIDCFVKNRRRVLDCREEFDQFKQQIQKLEADLSDEKMTGV